MKKLKIKLYGKPHKGATFLSSGSIKKDLEKLEKIKQKQEKQQFLVLCDLHFLEDGQLDILTSLQYDCCLLLGDIPSDALICIKKLINKPIYAIAGNHDTREMYEKAGIEYINGRCVSFNGFTIAGIEGSNRYKNTKELVMLTQKESLEVAKQLPKADILISHDSCFKKFGKAPNNCGLKGISRYIKTNKPMLHLHGHYHTHAKYKVRNTICIACYRCMLVDTDGKVEMIF